MRPSAPVPSSDGRLQVEVGNISMCLQPVASGDLLDIADADQVHAAGATLARLHQALVVYPDADEVVGSEELPETLTARVTHWIDSAGDHVPGDARDTLRELVAAAPAGPLPTQLVHGDFRSSNVLCTSSTISAVIDFEEARLDHCIDEIARSAVMLGTRFRNWGPVSAEVREMFRSGYESVRRFTSVEAGWWDILVLWYSWALVPPGDDPTGWGYQHSTSWWTLRPEDELPRSTVHPRRRSLIDCAARSRPGGMVTSHGLSAEQNRRGGVRQHRGSTPRLDRRNPG